MTHVLLDQATHDRIASARLASSPERESGPAAELSPPPAPAPGPARRRSPGIGRLRQRFLRPELHNFCDVDLPGLDHSDIIIVGHDAKKAGIVADTLRESFSSSSSRARHLRRSRMRRSRTQQAAAQRGLVLGEGQLSGQQQQREVQDRRSGLLAGSQRIAKPKPVRGSEEANVRACPPRHGPQLTRSRTPTYIASLTDDDDDDDNDDNDEGEGGENARTAFVGRRASLSKGFVATNAPIYNKSIFSNNYDNSASSSECGVEDELTEELDSVDSGPRYRPPSRPSSAPLPRGVFPSHHVYSKLRQSSTSPATVIKNRRSLKRVRVAVRCRPVFPELDFPGQHDTQDQRPAVRVENAAPDAAEEQDQVHIFPSQESQFAKCFRFDHVFGPEASQDAVYNVLARPIVEDVLLGMNGAIIAYGQTGTGKTYTMGILDRVSAQGSHGIIPSALRQVFSTLEREFGRGRPGRSCTSGSPCACGWTVELSFLQIYLEALQDLFAPYFGENVCAPLSMRQDPKNGFFVQGLRSVSVRSLEEAITLVNLGLESRQMASTGMNAASSRSHTVLTAEIKVHRCQARATSQTGVVSTVSRLRLVDLAGSERVRTASRASMQVKEAQSINMSLSALGNVVAALAQRDQQASNASASRPSTSASTASTSVTSSNTSRAQASLVHIPFRGSQLTKLLQDTLGGGSGGSNTVLVAAVSPSPESCRETLSTLKFASRCMRVRSDAKIRRQESGDVDYARLCAILEHKLEAARTSFAEREATLRRSYESRIAELARGEGPVGGHALYFDMYRTVMELETGFRSRLDEQRASLRAFIKEQVPQARQARLLGVVERDPAQDDDRLGDRVAAVLGMSPAEISRSHLRSDPLSPGTSAEELAVHARIASEALRIEADDANALLHLVMDELLAQYTQGAKREEDLASCSTILEFLLKTNSDLRAEISSVGLGPSWSASGGRAAKNRPDASASRRSGPAVSNARISQPVLHRKSQLDEYLGSQ